MTIQEKITLAKLLSVQWWPYLSEAVVRVPVRYSKHVPTMGVTDEWILYINPEWAESKTVAELALIISGHEVGGHLLNDHASRCTGLHHELSNIAGDLAINCRLDNYRACACVSGDKNRIDVPEIPSEALMPKQFIDKAGNPFPPDLILEDYYALLINNANQKPGPKHQCGSGATGTKADWEESEKSGDDGSGQGRGVSPAEASLIRDSVAKACKSHEEARGRGSVPEGLLRWADDRLRPPQVPWTAQVRRKISRIVAGRGRSDYSYSQHNRRSKGRIILPGMIEHKHRANAVFDTSGSMSDGRIRAGLSELVCAASHLGPIEVFACDAAAAKAGTLRTKSDVKKLELRGGGGTDMGAGLLAAAESKPMFTAVFTDGDTPWPDTKPIGLGEVLVVLIGKYGVNRVPAWADWVAVEDE